MKFNNVLLFPLFLFPFFIFLLSCSSPTQNNTVTFSGKVTLEDTTDFSGVTVSLYKPVELDTALTNLNARYPGVGIEVNQRTEFFWREHQPLYTTTTVADGSWKIDKVEKGTYHIVVQAAGYGWRVSYNAAVGAHDITLKKALTWKGTYGSPVTVPPNSFVQITGNATFESGADLTVGPGTILEFQNNAVLETHATVNLNGALGSEIYIVPKDTANSSRMRLIESDNSVFNYVNCMYVKNGIYLNSVDSIQIQYSRFRNQSTAIEFFNCSKAHVENNVISNMTDGLLSKESNLKIIKNLITEMINYGIKSTNENDSHIKNNVFKNCNLSGIGFNISGSPGSYAQRINYEIYYNDFKENKIHIYVGRIADCIANNNNFWHADEYIVKTSGITYLDSLNFKYNYWNYFTDFEINQKILDKSDRIGEHDEGPFINFSGFRTEAVKW